MNSFVGTELADAAAAKKAYQDLILVSAGFCIFLSPIMILTADRYHLGWQIAISFIGRAIVFICGWPFINSPTSYGAYINGVAMLYLTGASWS